MISSTSSSPDRAARPPAVALLAAAALLVAAAGCASGRASRELPFEAGPRARIALLPPENLTAGTLPVRRILGTLEVAVARAGLEVVSGDAIQEFLARHRIRYTGGVDGAMARAAQEELGVDALLVSSVELYAPTPPRFGVALRLVSAGEEPRILWTSGFARAGDDSPGLLRLGVVEDLGRLERDALDGLARSLADFLAGEGARAPTCPSSRRFRPRIEFRAPDLDPEQTYSVAVLPFLNETDRRFAGEVVALEFVRQLQARPGFEVLEPGVVRENLLKQRIVMEGGVSLETARLLLGTLAADLIVAGYVREYEDAGEAAAVPRVHLTVLVIESRTNRVVWHSTSYNRGDDGVFLFDWGRISTAPALTCRIARRVADGISAGDASPARRPTARPPPESVP